MAISLTSIDSSNAIQNAPEIFNENYGIIQEAINSLLKNLNPDTRKLKLVDVIDPGNGEIACSAIIAVASSGKILDVRPAGGSSKLSIDAAGNIISNKIIVNGDDASTYKKMTISEVADFTGLASFKGVINLNHANNVLVNKHSNVAISQTNIGATASTPLNVKLLGTKIFLDLSNNGQTLTGSGEALLKINNTNLIEGQEIEIYIAKKNSGDTLKMYNGTDTAEYFAKMTTEGFAVVPHDDEPTHDNSAGAYLKLLYMAIEPNNFKLLILDKKGF